MAFPPSFKFGKKPASNPKEKEAAFLSEKAPMGGEVDDVAPVAKKPNPFAKKRGSLQGLKSVI